MSKYAIYSLARFSCHHRRISPYPWVQVKTLSASHHSYLVAKIFEASKLWSVPNCATVPWYFPVQCLKRSCWRCSQFTLNYNAFSGSILSICTKIYTAICRHRMIVKVTLMILLKGRHSCTANSTRFEWTMECECTVCFIAYTIYLSVCLRTPISQ